MRFGRLAAGVALSFFVVGGCSQTSPSTDEGAGPTRVGVTKEAIQGGANDNANHPFAVGICAGNSVGSCDFICSGTLITPNLVVTARHCVDQAPHEIDCDANPSFGGRQGAMFITTSAQIPGAAATRHSLDVSKIVTPTDRHICGHDIALLILDDVIAASEATPVVPGVQYPMGDTSRYVHKYTAVGYGNTGPEPSGTGAGTRRLRQNIPVECIPNDEQIPCPAEVNANEFYAGDGTCSGDSGSGAYDNTLFNAGKAVSFGVLSRGGDNANPDAGIPATLCKGALYTRLDAYRDLVVQAAETASANWTLYPKPVPDWTIYVPPPAEAGAPEAGPPKKPKPRENGVACDTNDQCTSMVCADTGAGKACTDACVDTAMPSTCAAGFYCKNAVCIQGSAPVAAAPAAAAETTTTSGCSVSASGEPSRSGLGAVGVVLGAFLALGLRRRRAARGGPKAN